MDGKQRQFILSVARSVDPPYADLYYELDTKNGGKGVVVCGNFEWDRAKSNANVKEKGFSFYLARTIFFDRCLTGVGKGDTSSGENRMKVAGRPMGSPKMPLLVVVEVALDGEGNFHRIISSWENESLVVEKMYNDREIWISAIDSSFNLLDRELIQRESDRDAWKRNVPPGVRDFLDRGW
jgi:uncharacterized DUF497 family protein